MSGTVHFGASTWTYPGWEGLVYQDVRAYGRRFKADSLSEYVSSGYFDCVGIDNMFYGFPSDQKLLGLKKHLPEGFPCIVKVPRELTYPYFSHQFGPREAFGTPNPRFLDPFVAREGLLRPFRQELGQNEGIFVLQFPPMPRKKDFREFWFEQLDYFLGELNGEWPLAVEVRNEEFLGTDYFTMLRDHGAAHVFQVWTGMPLPDEVLETHPSAISCASFVACRALVCPGVAYKDAVDRFSPYSRLVEPNPRVRRSILSIVEEAIVRDLPIYTTVNNRLEGCAPLTIQALKDEIFGGK